MNYVSNFILLIILFFLIYIYFKTIKENFIDIDFVNYKNSQLDDSDRAIYDDALKLSTMPKVPSDKPIDIDYSIVSKNLIYYLFKKSICFFKINKNIKIKNNKLTLDFIIDTPEDYKNLIGFILLNPIYIEFIINDNITDRYIVQLSNFTSKDIVNNKISISFIKDIGTVKNDFKNFTDNKIAFYIYYFDNDKNNFQNIGRELKIQEEKLITSDYKSMIIYNKNYLDLQLDESTYQFMNLFRQMYLSFIVPDITFDFNISINKDFNYKNQQLLSCAILGKYIGARDSDCANNIISCDSIIENKNIILRFSSGDNTSCGHNDSSLKIKLPKPSDEFINGMNLNVCVTIGTDIKIGFVKWNDINYGNKSKNISYSVNKIKAQNNYTDIFKKSSFPRYPLENTALIWNNKFILKQPTVSLGNTNFLLKYNAI